MGAAAPGKMRLRHFLKQALEANISSFTNQLVSVRQHLLFIVKKILLKPSPWIDSSMMLKDASVKAALQSVPANDQLQLYAKAVRLLSFTKMVVSDMGTNTAGTPLIFSIKRVLLPELPAFVLYANILSALNLGTHEYIAMDAAAADVPKPIAAPSLTLPHGITGPESVIICNLMVNLQSES